ncbi:hypothetical protein RB195_020795 [Necator americanus]|uniref:Uncharacterized protein n=1 Tax=Necator americanus TaxID=51031 RepID=A0ABR1CLZ7_NECAM
MTPLDALPYSQFLFYNALDLTTQGFLPYSLVQPLAAAQFQAPQVLGNEGDYDDYDNEWCSQRPFFDSSQEKIFFVRTIRDKKMTEEEKGCDGTVLDGSGYGSLVFQDPFDNLTATTLRYAPLRAQPHP